MAIRTIILLMGIVAFGVAGQATADCSIKQGDLNFDLLADVCDFELLIASPDAQTPCADINGDGFVNADDYYALNQIISHETNACTKGEGTLDGFPPDAIKPAHTRSATPVNPAATVMVLAMALFIGGRAGGLMRHD